MFPAEVKLWNVVKDDGEGTIWAEARISTCDAECCPAMSDPTNIWGYDGEYRMVEAIVFLIRNGIKYTIIEDSDLDAWPVSDGWRDLYR